MRADRYSVAMEITLRAPASHPPGATQSPTANPAMRIIRSVRVNLLRAGRMVLFMRLTLSRRHGITIRASAPARPALPDAEDAAGLLVARFQREGHREVVGQPQRQRRQRVAD